MAKSKTDWTPVVIAGAALWLLSRSGGTSTVQVGGALVGFIPTVEPTTAWGPRAQAVRNISASGQITNTGNVTTTYQVRLHYRISDSTDTMVIEDRDAAVVGNITLSPGQTSTTIAISGQTLRNLQGGEWLDAWVILDATNPARSNLAMSTPASWQEPTQAAGSLTGFTPSISQR